MTYEGRHCGVAGVLTETTAELAVSLTFAAARRVVEADRFMRKGLYLGWAPTLMVGQLLQVSKGYIMLRKSALKTDLREGKININCRAMDLIWKESCRSKKPFSGCSTHPTEAWEASYLRYLCSFLALEHTVQNSALLEGVLYVLVE